MGKLKGLDTRGGVGRSGDRELVGGAKYNLHFEILAVLIIDDGRQRMLKGKCQKLGYEDFTP